MKKKKFVLLTLVRRGIRIGCIPWARLQVAPSSAYRITQEGANAVLEFDGKRHLLPAQVRSAVDGMVESASFRTAELPGPMSADAKLALGRYLYNIGFLVTGG